VKKRGKRDGFEKLGEFYRSNEGNSDEFGSSSADDIQYCVLVTVCSKK